MTFGKIIEYNENTEIAHKTLGMILAQIDRKLCKTIWLRVQESNTSSRKRSPNKTKNNKKF